MARCMSCDAVNSDQAAFCTACGKALTTTGGAPPPAATFVQPQPPLAATTVGSVPGAAAAAAPNTPLAQVINNITMAPATPTVVVINQQAGPGLLVRALYFYFIGLWLGAFCTVLAWFLNVTIIGLPLGLMIINRLPQIMTLKPTPSDLQVTVQNGVVIVQQSQVQQQSFLIRAIYFLLVGWWASGVWLLVAWALVGITFGLGLPLAFWMFNRVPVVTTLRR